MRNRPTKHLPTKRRWQDRSTITLDTAHEIRLWRKALGTSKDELLRAVAKVGNNAAAVRKELARSSAPAAEQTSAQAVTPQATPVVAALSEAAAAVAAPLDLFGESDAPTLAPTTA